MNEYHCSGAGAIDAAKASAISCVAAWRLAGSLEDTSIGGAQVMPKVLPSALRRIVTGRIREPVLAASVAGPAGSVVQASKSLTGMPSGR